MSDNNAGVLAFGDSITNGGGELQWGVALQSWALWTARGLGVPYTGCAVDGATASDVVGVQIPAFLKRAAAPEARYDVGCLYIGVNDVRGLDWEAAAFEHDYAEALRFVSSHSDRVLAVTAPLDLGRPRAGAKVRELNAVVLRAARSAGALLLDLSGFGARNLVMADAVHPTAFGQIAIAERALDVLAADGMRVAVRPSSLIIYETSWRGQMRGDLTYAYRRAKVALNGLAFHARARLAP